MMKMSLSSAPPLAPVTSAAPPQAESKPSPIKLADRVQVSEYLLMMEPICMCIAREFAYSYWQYSDSVVVRVLHLKPRGRYLGSK